MKEMEFLLQTLDLSSGQTLYFLCICVPFYIQNLSASKPDIASNGFSLKSPPAGSNNFDYVEDYWVGPIPRDYTQVNEKSIERKAFEPAKFKFTGKNNIEAQVYIIAIF